MRFYDELKINIFGHWALGIGHWALAKDLSVLPNAAGKGC